MADYYKTLGVEKNASADEIKKAYRKLAHQYHPDKTSGDEAKFKEINEAYQTLSDPKKKTQYDQFGLSFAQGFGGQGRQNGQGQRGGFDGFDFSQFGGFGGQGEGNIDFEDIFEMFSGAFGGRGPRRAQENAGRGRDIEVNLTIDFHDSARGVNKTIELNKDARCDECSGTGAKKGTDLATCSVCGGKGEVKETTRSIFGNIARIAVCGNCKGAGKIPKENCPVCLGEGRRKTQKTLEITIPAGIRDGEALVVKGQGQAGFRNSQSGDLYIRVRVNSDRRFQRINNDILFSLPLKLTDALLGKKITIPTLDGDREVEIPSGIRDGEELRLKGYGIHGRNKGDQIIKIHLEMPRKLSGRARRLVEELDKEI